MGDEEVSLESNGGKWSWLNANIFSDFLPAHWSIWDQIFVSICIMHIDNEEVLVSLLDTVAIESFQSSPWSLFKVFIESAKVLSTSKELLYRYTDGENHFLIRTYIRHNFLNTNKNKKRKTFD